MADLKRLVRRLREPADVQMATRVALLLLLGELVLCGLIIWRVPCECYMPLHLPAPTIRTQRQHPKTPYSLCLQTPRSIGRHTCSSQRSSHRYDTTAWLRSALQPSNSPHI